MYTSLQKIRLQVCQRCFVVSLCLLFGAWMLTNLIDFDGQVCQVKPFPAVRSYQHLVLLYLVMCHVKGGVKVEMA